MDPQPEPVNYICGNCWMENTLKPGDVIQCRPAGNVATVFCTRNAPAKLFSTRLTKRNKVVWPAYEEDGTEDLTMMFV